jgi:hypothetical protein
MISINPTVEMLQQNASSDKFDIRSFPTGHAFQMFLDDSCGRGLSPCSAYKS